MARKKTIMKSDILDTAYEVIRTEGFEGFTARNIAKKMNCSTQPIYLEFKNMEDLKKEIVSKIKEYLTESIYTQERTDNPVLNVALNYIHFAHDESVFFKAVYLENRLDAVSMHEISKEKLNEVLAQTDEGSTKDVDNLFIHFWATVHGTASMIAQEVIPFNQEDTTHYLEQSLNIIMK